MTPTDVLVQLLWFAGIAIVASVAIPFVVYRVSKVWEFGRLEARRKHRKQFPTEYEDHG